MTRLEQRRAAAVTALSQGSAESGAGSFLTRDAATVRYLTGFSGSNAVLLLDEGQWSVITDGRYRDQARRQVVDADVIVEADVLGAAIRRLSRGFGLVRATVTLDPTVSAGDAARLHHAGFEVLTADPCVHRIRQVKDADEVANLERACAITAEAMQQVASVIRLGMTEIEIARRVETLFGELGADDRAFPTIVATGEHSAIPHHRPTATAVRRGDLLVIDCGALVHGYHADMTRTFVVATDPQDWQTEIHAAVQSAQAAGRLAIGPRASGRGVDAAARQVVEDAGFESAFTHGTGHGVGLQIHEAPMASTSSADTIDAGSVMTVEPGIYLPGRGGVRIEDTVVVGESARVLTEAPRNLVRVG